MPNKITSWSFSRYSDYSTCPAKAKYKHLDKLPEPKNPAMQRGADIGKAGEDYIKGKIARLPPELKLFKVDFTRMRKLYKDRTKLAIKGMAPIVEDMWAFTKNWTITTWNDWANCVVRVKLDAAEWLDEDTLLITDWKTGKFRIEKNSEYMQQLELYALAAFMLYGHLKTVKVRLAYTDLGITFPSDKPLEFHRAEALKLKKTWEKRTVPMMADTRFAPRPGDYCRFCHFRKSNDGPCKF